MADPVAEKSTFLKMYMSSHPDTLIAYAKWFGKVEGKITSAEMSAIDTKSMTLGCTFPDGSKRDVRVEISPPLNGYDDVKPRLLEMKAIAQEALGMIKTPQIKTFELPAWTFGSIFPTFFLVPVVLYLGLAPADDSSPFWAPAQIARGVPYIASTAKGGVIFMITAHILESLYALYLCRKHSAPPLTTFQYVFATLYAGAPIWKSLRQRIQTARIDSVMKVE